ncbi:hypothetical protein ACFYSC_07890 [Streptosporangium sp. NPDC004379]|uniref:hypothetical protein n=1 Tax=Streptosporangium sp. NPDC004379 TaxID=3366189 RepID=UPI0036833BDF
MNRARLTASAFAAGGVLFLIYQAARPYADESTLEGAAAMASPSWTAVHLAASVGFVLVSLGILGLYLVLGRSRLLPAAVVTWLGAGLTLPYYGAETFGLRVIGARAVRDHDAGLIELVDQFRFTPAAVAMFAAGLALLAVGVVMAAVEIRRSGALPRWSGVPLAVGFVLFIPQFYGSPAIRIAHGALLAAGGLWLAYELWRVNGRVIAPAGTASGAVTVDAAR